jgi:hypothetical protein
VPRPPAPKNHPPGWVKRIDRIESEAVNWQRVIARSPDKKEESRGIIMMNSRFPKAYKAAALTLVLTLMNLYVGTALAAPRSPQASGKLTTTGNQPVLVNGNSAGNGATILTGATIETGDQVGATIDLGPLGTVDIAPNTKIQVEFDENGNLKVVLVYGCVIARPKKGNHGEIYTEDGKQVTHNDPQSRPAAILDVCFPKGAPAPIVNQGAAANAGAGAGGGGGGGISNELVGGLLGGIGGTVLIIILLADRGDDPSPSS